MANEEHLNILRQGVEVWNRWRRENPNVRPDLRKVNLSETDLLGANLSGVDLYEAILERGNLKQVSLVGASLRGANLSGAGLARAHFNNALLINANLAMASLNSADFTAADLAGTDFTRAKVGGTNFCNVDLSTIKRGLDTVDHYGPSTIGIDTIYRSKGQIPEAFLQGCGLRGWEIEAIKLYRPRLTSAEFTDITYKIHELRITAIHYHSCFISYSSRNKSFAGHLHQDLQNAGVRCWFAPEDMKIGDKIRPRIDESIRIHDKLLLILSKHSINSDWVEKEVETAFEEERKRNQTVLFPVRLDKMVMETDQAWAADIRRTRHIGDFSRWKNHDLYQQAFERLLRDLKAEG